MHDLTFTNPDTISKDFARTVQSCLTDGHSATAMLLVAPGRSHLGHSESIHLVSQQDQHQSRNHAGRSAPAKLSAMHVMPRVFGWKRYALSFSDTIVVLSQPGLRSTEVALPYSWHTASISAR